MSFNVAVSNQACGAEISGIDLTRELLESQSSRGSFLAALTSIKAPSPRAWILKNLSCPSGITRRTPKASCHASRSSTCANWTPTQTCSIISRQRITSDTFLAGGTRRRRRPYKRLASKWTLTLTGTSTWTSS